MKVTEYLLSKVEDIWEEYHSHPFVTGIADGTLDREKFRYYIIQDYLYLIDYAKVFALGVTKAADLETMTFFAKYIHQILSGEMDIHNGYMGEMKITEEEMAAAKPALDNISYTSYMLRVAYDEGPAQIAAAILSCALSYEVIAKKMMEQYPDADKDPFYGEWVKGYASEEYHQENVELCELMERLSEGLNEEHLEHLADIFIISSRYEKSFWDMAWEMKN